MVNTTTPYLFQRIMCGDKSKNFYSRVNRNSWLIPFFVKNNFCDVDRCKEEKRSNFKSMRSINNHSLLRPPTFNFKSIDALISIINISMMLTLTSYLFVRFRN